MADAGYITEDAADHAAQRAAVGRAARARSGSAVFRRLRRSDARPSSIPSCDATTRRSTSTPRSTCTCSGRAGRRPRRPDQRRRAAGRRKRNGGPGRAIAVDPRTGEILALVGGRSYNQSQYNRAIIAPGSRDRCSSRSSISRLSNRRPPKGRTDITPATIVDDEPDDVRVDDQVWAPENYENEYDGPITLRRALAMSRNLADHPRRRDGRLRPVATCGSRSGSAPRRSRIPSIALGVFEATPFEIATAYTIFPNGGEMQSAARTSCASSSGGKEVTRAATAAADGRAPRHDLSWSRT